MGTLSCVNASLAHDNAPSWVRKQIVREQRARFQYLYRAAVWLPGLAFSKPTNNLGFFFSGWFRNFLEFTK